MGRHNIAGQAEGGDKVTLFGKAMQGGRPGSLLVGCQFFFHHLLRPARPNVEGARLSDRLMTGETDDVGRACEGGYPAGMGRRCCLRLE